MAIAQNIEQPIAEHEIECAHCNSDRVVGNYNVEGLWYGYCLMCGTRFWDHRLRHAD